MVYAKTFSANFNGMILYLVFILLLCWNSNAFSAPPPVTFSRLSTTQGLPQNTGRVLLQDRQGYIWIGTEDGLVRYDGSSMVSYRKQHGNPVSLSDNYISALAEGPAGNIWVGTMGGGLNKIDPKTGIVSRIQPLSGADILAMALDPSAKRFWLGTGNGLYRLDIGGASNGKESPLVASRVAFKSPDGKKFNTRISGIVALNGEIWFSTRGQGIGRYNPEDDVVIWYLPGENGLEDDTFNMIMADGQGTLWAGGQNHGLVKVILQGENVYFIQYSQENSELPANDIMAVADADDKKLWVGTWNGGFGLFEPATGKIEPYLHNAANPDSLPSNIIMDILRAKDGRILLGTFDRGICRFNPAQPFRTYKSEQPGKNGLPDSLIWSFASTDDTSLWVGTAKGLTRLNPETNEYALPDGILPVELWRQVRNDDIRALEADENGLWIAARHTGLVYLAFTDNRLTPITKMLGPDSSLTHPYIRLLLQDHRGYIWLGAARGLNRFDPVTGSLRTYLPDPDNPLSLPHQRIRGLYEDSGGQIWVGTSHGLLLFDKQDNPLKVWKYDEKIQKQQLLTGNDVRGISEDAQSRIWIATDGGISIYNQQNGKVIILREEQGLPSNTTYCVLPQGRFMWTSTLHGLARINTEDLQVETYTTADGLPGNEFNFNAWQSLVDGHLAFGTLFGFTLFDPEDIPAPEHPQTPPPLWIRSYRYDDNDKPTEIFPQKQPVRVNWQHNQIAFEYGALSFCPPELLEYSTLLRGADGNWRNAGSRQRTVYSGLAPGRYSFTVRCRDLHGQWQAESQPIRFTVQAPPWKSTWAYIMYGTASSLLLLILFKFYNRHMLEQAAMLRKLVNKRTAELEQSNRRLAEKNDRLDQLVSARERLFRAVSHELRTPLTVIMSVLDLLQQPESNAQDKVPIAGQSARHLERLLDNILELSRQEAKISQEAEPYSIREALQEAIEPYTLNAAAEHKHLSLFLPDQDGWLALPRESFLMMVSNLLSNGCKYTEAGGHIIVRAILEKKWLQLVVEDDGIGISKGMEEQIFEWFGRGNNRINGWGIGLAFVRETAESAGGSIHLDTEAAVGTRLILRLPVAATAVAEKDIKSITADRFPVPIPGPQNTPQKPRTMVLVEDDTNLLKIMPAIFPARWNCVTAATAEAGWVLTLEKKPDLVLTDLMLPGESGFELTKKLKEDGRTAHIPVIILTALGDDEHRLAGLGLSADSFMSKPFRNRELLVRIQGLIDNRERVANQARKSILGLKKESAADVDISSSENGEDPFLQKLHAVMNGDIMLSTVTLEDIAIHMGMSKRSFQRGMQRLGINWREYKQLYRLRLAMDLLREPANRVGMVAEKSGYSSSAHFSRVFKQHTGMSPTEWKRSQNIG